MNEVSDEAEGESRTELAELARAVSSGCEQTGKHE